MRGTCLGLAGPPGSFASLGGQAPPCDCCDLPGRGPESRGPRRQLGHQPSRPQVFIPRTQALNEGGGQFIFSFFQGAFLKQLLDTCTYIVSARMFSWSCLAGEEVSWLAVSPGFCYSPGVSARFSLGTLPASLGAVLRRVSFWLVRVHVQWALLWFLQDHSSVTVPDALVLLQGQVFI